MQNIYAPFSLTFHMFFCIAATIIYLVQYYRKRYTHYILLIVAIDLTLIAQFTTLERNIIILGVTEIILLAAIFTLMIRVSIEKKRLARNDAK